MAIPTQPVVVGGFPAHAVLEPLKSQLITQIRDLVSALSPDGRFPGPNPCSIERANLQNLSNHNWLCEKTDGTRVLLVFLTYDATKLALLVTRAWDIYVIGVRCCPKVLFQGTVFDGELVFKHAWTWLGFDAAIVSGIPVFKMKFSERLECARRAMKAYAPHPKDSLTIEFKHFFRNFADYKTHLRSATHPIDGTIVTPEDPPIVIGRHLSMFKLKSDGKHTVDFEFAAPNILSVYDTKSRKPVHVGNLIFSGHLQNGCIVEASWKAGNDWTLATIRTDKATSNDYVTYTKTMINIRENLGLHDLEATWTAWAQ
jgi:hypothetical protein